MTYTLHLRLSLPSPSRSQHYFLGSLS